MEYLILLTFLIPLILGVVLYNQKPMGVSYLYPFLPFDEKEIVRFFSSSTSLNNVKRNKILKIRNIFRRRKWLNY